MPRPHEQPCECNDCWASELQDKYPDLLSRWRLQDIGDIWSSYSDEAAATWLDDDRVTVFQVFYQAPEFIAAGKPENWHWRTGRFFQP